MCLVSFLCALFQNPRRISAEKLAEMYINAGTDQPGFEKIFVSQAIGKFTVSYIQLLISFCHCVRFKTNVAIKVNIY